MDNRSDVLHATFDPRDMQRGSDNREGKLHPIGDHTLGNLRAANDVMLTAAFLGSESPDRPLLDLVPAAVYTTDESGRLTFYNDAAADLWGFRPELGVTEASAVWRLLNADGTVLEAGASPLAVALKEDRALRRAEGLAERADGTRVPFLSNPTPLHDSDGKLIGVIDVLADNSESKQAEARQQLLIRELHHRVKNTLATVQAIMSSTARASSSIDEFQEAFTGRVICISNTHSLLTEDAGQAVSIERLLRSELDAFDDGSGKRILIEGEHILLPSSLAVLLGLAIHELTINARKYGALSVLGGQVSVTWRVLEAEGERRLDFIWSESGVPAFDIPTHRGFGFRLLRQVLPMQTAADVNLDFASGLAIRLQLPLK